MADDQDPTSPAEPTDPGATAAPSGTGSIPDQSELDGRAELAQARLDRVGSDIDEARRLHEARAADEPPVQGDPDVAAAKDPEAGIDTATPTPG